VTAHLALAALVLLSAAPAGAQEWARAALDASPRHSEWAQVPAGDHTVHAFVVYPERKDAAPAVIVIHENRGLTDWVRSFADRLAGEGYLAIAPDLLSGFDAKHQRTADFADDDAARDAIYALDPDRITADLRAVQRYVAGLPAAGGKTAVIGFCWGGGEAFNYALKQPALVAAVSYYGPMPSDPKEYTLAEAPILGLYGGADERVDANIPVAKTELAKTGSTYEPHVFEGAGHGFLRAQDGQNGANMRATRESWPLVLEFLRKHLEI
jgi:carboxymethylenebutenolidase